MFETIIVFSAQIVFSFSRTLNTRYVARDKMNFVLITGFVVKCTWLLNTYIGVTAIIESDYKTIIAYLIGGMIGDYISLKIKIK